MIKYHLIRPYPITQHDVRKAVSIKFDVVLFLNFTVMQENEKFLKRYKKYDYTLLILFFLSFESNPVSSVIMLLYILRDFAGSS